MQTYKERCLRFFAPNRYYDLFAKIQKNNSNSDQLVRADVS